MEKKILRILGEVVGEERLRGLPADPDLLDDVGLDSLQMMRFLMNIEDELDIEIDFEKIDYDSMRYLSKFVEFIENRKNEAIEV